jgi:hypothetical protein
MKRKTKDKPETLALRGFLRLQIVDKKTRKVVGDTGWTENQITNYGYESCFVGAPIGAGSVQAAGLMLGNGTNPASDATQLPSSNTDYYAAFGYSSVIASLTARVSCSFDGTLGAATFANMGLFAASNGTILCGKTFASSALTTDQDINASYEIRYS